MRNLKHTDIKNGSIRITRGKGSLGELTRISPRLQAAIDDAKAIYPSAPAPITGAYLLHDAKGLKVQKNRFDSDWQRVMEKAIKDRLEAEGVTIKLEDPLHLS